MIDVIKQRWKSILFYYITLALLYFGGNAGGFFGTLASVWANIYVSIGVIAGLIVTAILVGLAANPDAVEQIFTDREGNLRKIERPLPWWYIGFTILCSALMLIVLINNQWVIAATFYAISMTPVYFFLCVWESFKREMEQAAIDKGEDPNVILWKD